MICPRRRFSRKGERGTTVVVVVMVTTLITAIGIFAVRNIGQVDQAVGFSRQSAQTQALAELGTTVAMAQINAKAQYVDQMSSQFACKANGPYTDAPCYLFTRETMEIETAANGGKTLLQPAVSGSESGSFGPFADADGEIKVEMTEKHATNTMLPGTPGTETPLNVTLTTLALVSPRTGTAARCNAGVAAMAVKKVVRAHVIVPPN